jgi:hypothetical protein
MVRYDDVCTCYFFEVVFVRSLRSIFYHLRSQFIFIVIHFSFLIEQRALFAWELHT